MTAVNVPAGALRRLAFHEAAHAVAAVVLGVEVAWCDLEADGPGSGGTLVREVDPHTDAVIALAGYEQSGGRLTCPPSTHDTRAALQLVGEAGIEVARRAAWELLAAHRAAVAAVAAALLVHGRLSGGQVWALVRAVEGGR